MSNGQGISDFQVFGILGGLAAKHPSILSMGNQLIQLYKAHQDEVAKIYQEYISTTAGKELGPVQQAGVVLELMQLHPDAVPVLVQALGLLAPHIPELQQTLADLQGQVMALKG